MNKKKILIAVDLQKDFFTGTLGNEHAVSIIPNIVEKLKNSDHDYVLFTKDTHFENYMETLEGQKLPIEHCNYACDGWELIDEVKALYDEKTIRTIPKVSFGYPDWGIEIEYLTSYDYFDEKDLEIELIGVVTNICVISNALILRALYPNSKITVDASCCASNDIGLHRYALEVMKTCQIDVVNETPIFLI